MSGNRSLTASHRRGHLAPVLTADHVARREGMRHGGAKMLIYDDLTLLVHLHARSLDRDVVGIGSASSRYQEPLGPKLALPPGNERRRNDLGTLLPYGLRRRIENDLNPLLRKDRCDRAANFRFAAMGEQLRVAFQDRHGRSEPAEHLPQLQGDIPAPDDQE